MPDISVITKAILAAASSPEDIVQMAYELGVSHGRSQLAEERKKARPWIWTTNADQIATGTKLRSKLEARWFPFLCNRFQKVRYEPKRFPCYAEGKKTSYTPDFMCTPIHGPMVWIDTKSKDWRALKGWNASSDMRQLRRMQSCVKHHKIMLYVCSGEPVDGQFDTYQVLGLDQHAPDSPQTLVKTDLPFSTNRRHN